VELLRERLGVSDLFSVLRNFFDGLNRGATERGHDEVFGSVLGSVSDTIEPETRHGYERLPAQLVARTKMAA
jgi:hypothetical protein